jgi:formylglycine-generating enzyme required for sulfatase activity
MRIASVVLVMVPALTWSAEPPPGMVWVPPGEAVIGSRLPGALSNEQPVHTQRLDGFWMDRHEVTTAEFARFVAATGHVTVAERPVDAAELARQMPPGAPPPPAALLVPGALVFVPPVAVAGADHCTFHDWWQWVPGAHWRRPQGPGHPPAPPDHPVVAVAWADAVAYAQWAGKRLPTEAEWEWAARGGLLGSRYTWGDAAPTDLTGNVANIWQGAFPRANTAVDGFAGTAPVGRYPANGYGLHDMAGNAWEWCSDWYRDDAYLDPRPGGPATFLDRAEPLVPKRVIRGGSFLCHVTYCESYRISARRGGDVGMGLAHIGFRCVMTTPKQP